ncbi:dolichyl-diphosphooligosaccharide--protein glycosyltransferase subunit 1B-like [Chenopodium quinoa]|uniref:dolichyl-diphosphooligosaccharide--protein glycosyltransferase subunit 1B-like n=1 Tax=Chenopodium quinoa TaxID=63459 RepID=UPI000B77DDEB|nr:dolichyl-diphosphooligosaccharide--protein glycosyltransferase subunit 1B-like [Chenopodium quinoa]XP_021771024.1 dolichyl-diphosphooligosaccharide--protein glycosyltransferase subunit 1B-like [Chenopodium quinoa]
MAIELKLRNASIFSLLFFLSFILGSSSTATQHDLRITYAERRIDLTSHIIKVFLTLQVENKGTSPSSEVIFAFPPAQIDHIALLKAAVPVGKKKRKTYKSLDVSPKLPDGPNETKYFSATLLSPLKAGETVTLEVLYILTQSLEPFPIEISQSESQLVYYRDSAIILSPYHIDQQTTFIRTASTRVESFTHVEPTNRAGLEVKYGPYADQPPHSFSPIIVHFENNNPFVVVEELVREVEISHWGSIQVREQYTLAHAGARLKGAFSRVDYQSKPSVSGVASFKQLLATLPPRVNSVYYRDEIGNISTSRLRLNLKKSELEIEPRYPLFGGWRATFVIGYRLPLEDFLYESNDGKQRYLNFTFGCPMAETVVNKLTIKVALPEGSKNSTVSAPFTVEQHLETTYSYLDVLGRTVVVLEKKNVVPEHNSPFQVYYDFNPAFMLVEPLILVSIFTLFFLACIAYLHGDISIHKQKTS